MAADPTRLFEAASASFCLIGARVWIGSVNASFWIGRSPCSKETRLGWISEFGFGSGAEGGGDWSMRTCSSVMIRGGVADFSLGDE